MGSHPARWRVTRRASLDFMPDADPRNFRKRKGVIACVQSQRALDGWEVKLILTKDENQLVLPFREKLPFDLGPIPAWPKVILLTGADDDFVAVLSVSGRIIETAASMAALEPFYLSTTLPDLPIDSDEIDEEVSCMLSSGYF